MRRKNKSLLLLLLILGIGFASIATTLYINGNATISSNSSDFDVKFTKAIRGETDISSTSISADGKSITYTTEDLSEKDATSVLTYTVTNNSSLYDADVSVNCTTGTHNDLYSVTNSLDSPVEAKTSKDGTIIVKLLQDPEEELSEEFTCTLTATATERTKVASNENKNIASVLKYDETTGSNTYCVTGDEATCVENTCVADKTICEAGTIINYDVNDSTNLRFYVLHDDGKKITMQQYAETTKASWYANLDDYTLETGPLDALAALEETTENWTNVNLQNYSIGDETSTLGYSACTKCNVCQSTTYTLSRSNVRARMVTIQELYAATDNAVLCATNDRTTPHWMAPGTRGTYWTMNSGLSGKSGWEVESNTPTGWVNSLMIHYQCSVRAVVEINK